MADPHENGQAPRDAAILLVLAAAVFVPSLFTRDLWNPDEPRYAEVARAMLVSGSWAVPHLNGEPYRDKPPLVFWLSAVLMRLGAGIQSGRVVSAAASTGTLLITWWLGRRLYGREVGLWAALAATVMLLFMYMGKWGGLDAALCACTVGAIACGERALSGEGRRPGAWWLGFYGAVALGVLVKGPVALAVPGLVVVLYGLLRRRSVCGGGWWHLAGVGLFAAILAAWLVPARLRGGSVYFNEIVFGQMARRLGGEPSHAKPFYYYIGYAPGLFLPWSFLLPLALVAGWKAARRDEPRTWLPLVWFAVILVFFSCFTSKRERYILAIVPAAGLLVARYAAEAWAAGSPWPRLHRWTWRLTLVVLVGLAVVLGTAAVSPGTFMGKLKGEQEALAQLRAAFGPGRAAVVLAAAAVLVGAAFHAARLLGRRRTEPRRLMLVVAAVVAVSLALDLGPTPILDRVKSGRDLVQEARPYLDAADQVCLYSSDYSGVYNLYARRWRMPVVEAEALGERLRSDRRVAVIARERHLDGLAGMPFHVAVRERVGSKKMVVLINWEPEPPSAPTP